MNSLSGTPALSGTVRRAPGAAGLTVTIKPEISSSWLSWLHQYLVPRRDDIAEGLYGITFTPEDGMRVTLVEGGTERGAETIRRYLATPMAERVYPALAQAWRAIAPDDQYVTDTAAQLAPMVSACMQKKGEAAAIEALQNFRVQAGCPCCGAEAFEAAALMRIAEVELADKPEQLAAYRTEFEAIAAQLKARGTPVPTVGLHDIFLGGTVEGNHPFAASSYAALQAQAERLMPQVREKIVANLRERGNRLVAFAGQFRP